jgi:hypothetical protein
MWTSTVRGSPSAGNGPPFELLAEHGRLAIWRRFVATDRSTLLDEGARRA